MFDFFLKLFGSSSKYGSFDMGQSTQQKKGYSLGLRGLKTARGAENLVDNAQNTVMNAGNKFLNLVGLRSDAEARANEISNNAENFRNRFSNRLKFMKNLYKIRKDNNKWGNLGDYFD